MVKGVLAVLDWPLQLPLAQVHVVERPVTPFLILRWHHQEEPVGSIGMTHLHSLPENQPRAKTVCTELLEPRIMQKKAQVRVGYRKQPYHLEA
jgi:hypothetical protein